MLMRHIVPALVAIALTTANAAADTAQTPGSNVTISQCSLRVAADPITTQTVNEQGAPTLTQSQSVTLGTTSASSIRIGYTNDAAAAVAEIDFALVGRSGVMNVVKDVGKIAAGAEIQRDFKIQLASFPLNPGATKCIVTKVTYADGTSWTNPNPPQ
jgi:hypothetical protein